MGPMLTPTLTSHGRKLAGEPPTRADLLALADQSEAWGLLAAGLAGLDASDRAELLAALRVDPRSPTHANRLAHDRQLAAEQALAGFDPSTSERAMLAARRESTRSKLLTMARSGLAECAREIVAIDARRGVRPSIAPELLASLAASASAAALASQRLWTRAAAARARARAPRTARAE